jgi:hypothetical protein
LRRRRAALTVRRKTLTFQTNANNGCCSAEIEISSDDHSSPLRATRRFAAEIGKDDHVLHVGIVYVYQTDTKQSTYALLSPGREADARRPCGGYSRAVPMLAAKWLKNTLYFRVVAGLSSLTTSCKSLSSVR